MSGFSSRVMGLKFMQRAQEKETMAKTAAREAEAVDAKRREDEWHMPGFEPKSNGDGGAETTTGAAGGEPASRKPIIVQYLPRTAFVSPGPGRLSFGGFNKETERYNQERVDRERRVRAAAAAARSSNADVSDVEMAERLGRSGAGAGGGKKKKNGGEGAAGSRGSGEASAGKATTVFKKPPPLEAARREGKKRPPDGDGVAGGGGEGAKQKKRKV